MTNPMHVFRRNGQSLNYVCHRGQVAVDDIRRIGAVGVKNVEDGFDLLLVKVQISFMTDYETSEGGRKPSDAD
jgi:hypothetical protein